MNMRSLLPLLTLVAASSLLAHPMGNFSVNHYALIETTNRGVDVRYALDLAELPTYDLLRNWNLDRMSPRADLEKKAAEQAREWATHLRFISNGQPVMPEFQGAELVIADG